ncbi:hypothetical protein GW756_05190 [bacterium]|nr:hypothetical protein [bacterium]NCQ55773.1 hypothetical protein [Candidatus Parcubacteria bacterium]NCS67722.1 hypothetical protein [Candidatus Peregrinibacteria bacterium]NCS96736.1 hypothetical protein [bacterium]
MWTYELWPTQIFEWSWISLVTLVLVSAAYFDLKSRTIPNKLSLGGLLIMALYLWVFPAFPITEHLLGLLIGSIIFYSLFLLKVFGGGDSKLLIFVSLSFGAPLLISVWLWIFIIGGLQALFWRIFFKQKSMPYALSIALGSLFYILSSYL